MRSFRTGGAFVFVYGEVISSQSVGHKGIEKGSTNQYCFECEPVVVGVQTSSGSIANDYWSVLRITIAPRFSSYCHASRRFSDSPPTSIKVAPHFPQREVGRYRIGGGLKLCLAVEDISLQRLGGEGWCLALWVDGD